VPAPRTRGARCLGQGDRLRIHLKGFSRRNIDTNESDPRDSLVGMSLGLPPKPSVDFGVPAETYGFENKLLAWETIPPLLESCSPLRSSHLRDPVGPEIHFGSEQFIDEIAAATNEDPVAFPAEVRHRPRDAAVIKGSGRRKAGWQPRSGSRDRSGDKLTGRASPMRSAAARSSRRSAEIEVEEEDRTHLGEEGHRGARLRPRHQSRACATRSKQRRPRPVAHAFRGSALRRGPGTSVDWLSYPILDIADAPGAIEVVLINRPEVAPTGAGEPSIRGDPRGGRHAFFDATGVRLRKVPLAPERVRPRWRALESRRGEADEFRCWPAL